MPFFFDNKVCCFEKKKKIVGVACVIIERDIYSSREKINLFMGGERKMRPVNREIRDVVY